ncbi:hypothetical protein GGX14DRAFT_442921 [Mycena pura]|uniref:GATA-type domain-containing protein n=1 Tax=Mycena pura TaxID=153505 RepID=A0AAD6YEK0_9AGAR|nr:hypothetical protein GGX14DRAFT_442921 [Mycena pura]
MPHRVEPYPAPMSAQPTTYPAYPPPSATPTSGKARRSPYERRASPPPIATLPAPSHGAPHSGSPSPSASSLDRSAVSTPPARRTPPPPPPPQHAAHGHPHAYAYDARYGGGYMYAPPPPGPYHHVPHHGHHDDRAPPPPGPYDHHHGHYSTPFPIQHGGTQMAPPPPGAGGAPAGPGGVIQVVHTDDAATKLSDRVRRRCFNCCTTDTSTWRRSNLSPGKVLCNKCGLFERTHSRPRPEQFPHKRGPLAASTLRSRSPPGQTQQQQAYAPTHYAPPPPQQHTAPAPGSAGGSPYIAPLNPPTPSAPASASAPHANGNGAAGSSASAPGTPKPSSRGRAGSPARPGSSASQREDREERREERRDERRDE